MYTLKKKIKTGEKHQHRCVQPGCPHNEIKANFVGGKVFELAMFTASSLISDVRRKRKIFGSAHENLFGSVAEAFFVYL